ncbi:MAG TPA: hypothetical protein VEB42_07880, partial [Chitinophagaceae bacterium]|nr:hypothetical protein [Chitinophagaceae bacterium]
MFSQSKTRIFLVLLIAITVSCQKRNISTPAADESISKANNGDAKGHLKQTKNYSSDVVVKWLDQQLKMFRLPLAFGAAPATDRAFAYSGIALYESVVPGMPSHRSLAGQLNGFPVSSNPLPKTGPGFAYYWPACANAALAEINRKLFTGAPAQAAINQLENELQSSFAVESDEATLQRSIEFGRNVATAVWAWAQGDGTAVIAAQPAYVVPLDAPLGHWVPTSAG